ncbi:DNA mismatch repair protein MutS [Gluconobacter wancherniae]|nr:DNA mismatch repair protein MutS [Gluconobacter wancherniae]
MARVVSTKGAGVAKRVLREEEAQMWRSFVRDIVPLRPERPAAEPEKLQLKVPMPAPTAAVSEPALSFAAVMSGARLQKPARQQELRVGVRAPGLDDTSWKRLSRGSMKIDARLDLHGYIVQEAFERLHSFLLRARALNWRCVEVVTGLGSGQTSGMIRRELPLWLQRDDLRPMVLAVVHPHSANHGSVRILLKNRRRS